MNHCGLILRCDREGVVTEILHEGASLKGRAPEGRPLSALVAKDSVGKVLAFLAAAAGVGAVFVSFRNVESTLPGLAVFLVCLTAAVGFVATRSLVINGKRALCRDIEETLAERSRLQYLR